MSERVFERANQGDGSFAHRCPMDHAELRAVANVELNR